MAILLNLVKSIRPVNNMHVGNGQIRGHIGDENLVGGNYRNFMLFWR